MVVHFHSTIFSFLGEHLTTIFMLSILCIELFVLGTFVDILRVSPNVLLIHQARNMLIYDELNYDKHVLANEHVRLMTTMTLEQKRIYDTIMARVNANQPGVFFLYGYMVEQVKLLFIALCHR
jgi:hypothetical protein